MTIRENIKAILKCNFPIVGNEYIEIATNRIMEIIDNAPTVDVQELDTVKELKQQIARKESEINEAVKVIAKLVYKERPTGEWEEIESSSDIGHRFYHCSVCNRFLDVMTADGETLEDYPFCHCGADMRKQSEGLEDD